MGVGGGERGFQSQAIGSSIEGALHPNLLPSVPGA